MVASQILTKLSGYFDEAEVYIKHTEGESFELKNGKDYSKEKDISAGMGIRAIKDNKMVFISSTLDSDKIDDLIEEAVKSVKVAKPLECALIPKHSNRITSSIKTKKTDESDIKNKLKLIHNTAKGFDKRVVDVKSASITLSKSRIEIANSFGLTVSYDKSYASAFLEVLAQDRISDTGYYYLDSDQIDKIDLEFLAKNAANLTINKLYPQPINTKKYSIIIANNTFRDILAHFLGIFNGYSVVNHTTPLENKLNERIFSNKITIKDVAEFPDRPNNVVTDDEGNIRKDTVVVENGFLRSFLNNTYTANKLNLQNTANAKRASFDAPPKVGAFNLFIEPNSGVNRDKLLNMVDGVYITEVMGLHMANTISGDFSFGINGFLIHNGELVSYFKAATFADNFFQMMKRVIEVSNNLYFSGSVGSPDIAIADCLIGGGSG